MSLQSERLLNHMLRMRLSHMPNCYEVTAEEASAKDLPNRRNAGIRIATGTIVAALYG